MSTSDYTSKFIKRFWNRVNVPSNKKLCWNWKASTRGIGYGQVSFKNKKLYTHRVVWELSYGAIPDGLFVLHKCDNPLCVNPNHLFLGTNQDNMTDKVKKGRQSHGESSKLSKLSSVQIDDIRKRYRRGKISQQSLADEMGVSQSLISLILNRKLWKK